MHSDRHQAYSKPEIQTLLTQILIKWELVASSLRKSKVKNLLHIVTKKELLVGIKLLPLFHQLLFSQVLLPLAVSYITQVDLSSLISMISEKIQILTSVLENVIVHYFSFH